MATNRSEKIAKLHRVARKHYQSIKPPSNRTLLETVLYACCLEDSTYDGADEAFARLQHEYFDWNEVRVTTVTELADILRSLTNPPERAVRLKRTLHSIFETHYAFDIDALKKENLGKAIQKIERYKSITPFVVAYVAQNGVGGHAIPIDRAMLGLLHAVGIASDEEFAKQSVSGLERAIPKSKGGEFFSVTHQLAVDYLTKPFNSDIRQIILSIDPEAKNRFPRRGAAPEAKPAAPADSTERAKPGASKTDKGAKRTAPPAKPALDRGASRPAARDKKLPVDKRATAKKSATRRLAIKKPR
jgi:endonuclease-3